jgi:hypothetical protein
MIGKYLTNINNLIQYVILFLILLLIIYLIYKIFLIENEVLILHERISKIEYNQTEVKTVEKTNLNNEEIEIATNFMNEIFSNSNEEPVVISATSIDIDEKNETTEKPEEIFDLKKDVINVDETNSVVSTSNNKKKLQKMNLDKLKEKCQELGLSQEGSKATLIDRILDESNKDV